MPLAALACCGARLCRIPTGGGISPKPGGDAQVVVFRLPGAELERLQWAEYDGNKFGLTQKDDSKDLDVSILSDHLNKFILSDHLDKFSLQLADCEGSKFDPHQTADSGDLEFFMLSDHLDKFMLSDHLDTFMLSDHLDKFSLQAG